MKSHLRVVGCHEKELQIYKEKEKLAAQDFRYLIIQSICFQKLEEYNSIIKAYHDHNLNKNVDSYLNELAKYKYLYQLGVPERESLNRVKLAFSHIKAEGEAKYSKKEEIECRNLLARVLIRSVILNRPTETKQLFEIGKNFRTFRDVSLFKSSIFPFLYLLEFKKQ